MNLSTILESFEIPAGLAVTRRAAPTLANGIYTAGSSTSLTLKPAVVHPASGRQLALLPEGQRSHGAIVIYTRQALRGVQDPSGAPADLVTYGGITYEVQTAGDWSEPGGYYHSIAVKVPVS